VSESSKERILRLVCEDTARVVTDYNAGRENGGVPSLLSLRDQVVLLRDTANEWLEATYAGAARGDGT
jgi:hypothetical protein